MATNLRDVPRTAAPQKSRMRRVGDGDSRPGRCRARVEHDEVPPQRGDVLQRGGAPRWADVVSTSLATTRSNAPGANGRGEEIAITAAPRERSQEQRRPRRGTARRRCRRTRARRRGRSRRMRRAPRALFHRAPCGHTGGSRSAEVTPEGSRRRTAVRDRTSRARSAHITSSWSSRSRRAPASGRTRRGPPPAATDTAADTRRSAACARYTSAAHARSDGARTRPTPRRGARP